MKKQFFSNEKDGFYGTYYENPKGANCAMIGLFGDDPNDFIAVSILSSGKFTWL